MFSIPKQISRHFPPSQKPSSSLYGKSSGRRDIVASLSFLTARPSDEGPDFPRGALHWGQRRHHRRRRRSDIRALHGDPPRLLRRLRSVHVVGRSMCFSNLHTPFPPLSIFLFIPTYISCLFSHQCVLFAI